MVSRKNCLMACLLGFVTLIAACSSDAPSVDKKVDINQEFDSFKMAFLESFWQLSPEYALYSGRYEFAPVLSIPDAAERLRDSEFVAKQQALLKGFDLKSLNQTNRGDWAIIDNELRSTLWRLTVFKDYTWDPSRYNIAGPIGLLLNTDYESLDLRLLAIGDRLSKVPDYYRAAMANIDVPALPQTRIAIDQNKGALKLLEGRLSLAFEASDLEPAVKQDMHSRNDRAMAGIKDFIAFLEAKLPELEAGGARDFRIGADLYEQKFAFDIVSEFSAKQVYDLAVAEKRRLHQEMIKLADSLWTPYFGAAEKPTDQLLMVRQVIDKVAQTHAKPAEFVDAVRAQMPTLQAFIIAHDLLDIDPEKPLVVRETPEYQRGFSIASIEAPGPYDSAANTYYNVSPVDDLTPDMQESHLREYNAFTMQILNIHEAIPGHYTQLVHANRSPSLIKSIFGNGAMVEGWAVYTERMMLEQGYGDNQPELWLMYYKWNLRTVVNTILDYSIQVQGMEEQAALDLLMRDAFQEEAEARGKWRRASLSQVQLASYFTGYQEIYAFRESEKQRLGDQFDLKRFHNKFLSFGSAPVKVIKENMQTQVY